MSLNEKLKELTREWNEIGTEAISLRGDFIVAISATPLCLEFCRELAKTNWGWSATTLFLTDEKWTAVENDDSSYRKLYQSLYPHKPKIERWNTTLPTPQDALIEYDRKLKQMAGNPPKFDLLILELGKEQQIAGIYPESDASKPDSSASYVIWNKIKQIDGFRLTINLKAVKYSKKAWILTNQGYTQPEFLNEIGREFDIKSLE